jgi:glucose/arabinose dehydrogenase
MLYIPNRYEPIPTPCRPNLTNQIQCGEVGSIYVCIGYVDNLKSGLLQNSQKEEGKKKKKKQDFTIQQKNKYQKAESVIFAVAEQHE